MKFTRQAGPAIIVGAGPVGLTLALALHQRNIQAVVIEQRTERATGWAATLNPHALALYDQLGVIDSLVKHGRVVRRLSWHGPQGTEVLDYDKAGGAFPYRLHIAQDDLARVLLSSLPFNTVHWNRRLVHAELSAHGVVARLNDDVRMHGSMLVGADGFSSLMRRLRPSTDDFGERTSFGSAFASDDFAAFLPDDAEDCATIYGPEGWVIISRKPRGYRLHFSQSQLQSASQVHSDATPQVLATRFPGCGPTLSGLRSFSLRPRIARCFGGDRMYLAGDAAHVAFPPHGFSLGLGLQDAGELARAFGSTERLDAYANTRPARLRATVLADYIPGPQISTTKDAVLLDLAP